MLNDTMFGCGKYLQRQGSIYRQVNALWHRHIHTLSQKQRQAQTFKHTQLHTKRQAHTFTHAFT